MIQKYIFLLFIASFCLLACSPAKKIARRIGVNQKQLKKDIHTNYTDSTNLVRYDLKKYQIQKLEVTALDQSPKLFQQIKELQTDQYSGPYLASNKLNVYYLRKMDSRLEPYGSFEIIQFYQPFGLDDESFQAELDTIRLRCLANNQTLSEIKKVFVSENEIGIGKVLDHQAIQARSIFLPEIVDDLEDAPVYDCYQTKKATFGQVTLTELVQKTKAITYHEHIRYLKVFVKTPKK